MKGVELALVMTGVLLNAAAQLLLKAGARTLTGLSFTLGNAALIAERAILSVPILCGLLLYAISVVVWVLALSRVQVSVAYPMLSVGYVVNAVAAWYLFGENLGPARIAGIGIIILGVWLVARS